MTAQISDAANGNGSRDAAIRRFLKIAKSLGLFALCRYMTRRQLRILCYHGVWLGGAPHYGDCLFMDSDRFARRVEFLARLGYPVLPLEDAIDQLAADSIPDNAIAITIDDAWYSTHSRMLPVLKRYAMPATLYVTTYYATAGKPVLNVMIGYMVARASRIPDLDAIFAGELDAAGSATDADNERDRLAAAISRRIDALPSLDARWRELERIAGVFGFNLDAMVADRRFDLMNSEEIRAASADGFDIQLHTHTHRMHEFDPGGIANEVERNRTALAHILDVPADSLVHFCYPSGMYAPRVFDTLRELGVRSATTTEFGLNPAGMEPLALKRILDCDSMSEIELEARLCGFWSLVVRAKRYLEPSGKRQ